MPRHTLIHLIMRVGVALVFAYPALAALFAPVEWIGYMPDMLRALPVDDIVVLHIIGAGEMVLALWFLFGRSLFIPSVIASFFMVGIMLTNVNQFNVLFRDIAVLALTLSLAVWSYDGPSLIKLLRIEQYGSTDD